MGEWFHRMHAELREPTPAGGDSPRLEGFDGDRFVRQFRATDRILLWQYVRVAGWALELGDMGRDAVRAVVLDAEVPDKARAAAAKVLGGAVDSSCVAVMEDLLSSDDPWTRLTAAQTLAMAPSPTAVDTLTGLLDDHTTFSEFWCVFRVSNEAAVALHAADTERARQALEPWMESRRGELGASDEATRSLAVFVLAELGDPEAGRALRDLASEPKAFQAQDLLRRLTPTP